MKPSAFYHWHRWAMAALVAAATTSHAADEPMPRVPPRTIDDITRQLAHYKPDPTLAAKSLAEADQPEPSGADNASLSQFYWKRGSAAAKIGRINQQIADLRKASELAKLAGADEYVRMLLELASAENSGGNLVRALTTAETALKTAPAGIKGLQLSIRQTLVMQYGLVGDFDAASVQLKEIEGLIGVLKNSRNYAFFEADWNAKTERARAESFKSQGRMIEAEGAYRKALRWVESFIAQLRGGATHPNLSPNALNNSERFRDGLERNIGQTLVAQGKLLEGEIFIRQALRHSLERVGRASIDTGQGLLQLANVIAEENRYPEAIRLAEEAIRSLQESGAAPESIAIANARKSLAITLVAQQRYADAVKAFEEMRRALEADPEVARRYGSGDLDWVLAMLRVRNISGAESMSKAMLDKYVRNFGEKGLKTAEARAFYAMALADKRDHDAARKAFRESLPILIEQARSDEDAGTGSAKHVRRLNTLIERYIRLLAEDARDNPALRREAAAESFRLADIARGSSVQRALTASAARATIADPQLADLARREQDAQQRSNALTNLLTQLLSSPPDQQLPQIQAKLKQDIDTLKSERQQLKKTISQRFPDYADLVEPQPATLAGAQRLLRPGEALVSWYFGEEGGWVWAISKDGEPQFFDVGLNRTELSKIVTKLRQALDPGVASIDEIPDFDLSKSYQLYAAILKPVESVWGKAQVLLAVPHAELGQLPLPLLPTESVAGVAKTMPPFEGYRQVPWLARRIAVAQLPSVTALASLRKLPPGDANRRPFIGFGDPLFSVDQARKAKVALASSQLATRGAPLKLRSAPHTSGVSSAELSLLPRLPDTQEEISEIAKVLKADPAQDIYLQARATEKTVLNTPLNNRRVVMFATHGLVPGELDGLTQPALALTSPEVADPGGDGLLTMEEILTLKLNADWVVLSACNTAAGEGAGSEAVSGLGRAFFYAGARALLVSNWPVETVAARGLMTDLFRRQSDNASLGKAEALRQAMLGLMDGPGSVDAKTKRVSFSYAHPLFWAPFIVVGD
ncbi:tetratricopeptide repeat protein [Denitratisoma sp. agr-D3]